MTGSRAAEAETLAGWLMELCAVDTTTGREDAGLDALRGILDELDADVHLQAVSEGRSNVLATWGAPRVLFTTHVDTVPPYIPPRRESDRIVGRGSCDAKGQAVAQLGAARRLLGAGVRDIAWLGVVGEETSSDGARRALELADRLAGCGAVINGEPTGLALAAGQRGVLHLRLSCYGVTAHSSLPDAGRNAVWMLLDWLHTLRELPAARDAELGEESWSLGRIRGGGAINVVPEHAEAEILARTVPGSKLLDEIRAAGPRDSEVHVVLEEPPATFPALPGFTRAAMPYGSDAVTLRDIVADVVIVLAGPGTIDRAHTDDEHLRIDELLAGVKLHEKLALHFIGGDHQPVAAEKEG